MNIVVLLIGFGLGAASLAIGYLIGYQHGFDSALRNMD
jgi:hypothetical protein